MKSTTIPRVIIVTRPSEYRSLLATHGTHEQARFFLSNQGQQIREVVMRHERLEQALNHVQRAIPLKWRRGHVERDDLYRFVFRPEDIIVAVGQDGLIANVAKYLEGQSVIGINPDPGEYDGVLAQHEVGAAADILGDVSSGRAHFQRRTMVEASLEDGQRLLALNEIFVGHQSHQSARYRISCSDRSERQSSSGIIVSTGTGATGWARSVCLQSRCTIELPGPEDRGLAFMVREAFPSVVTGTSLVCGTLGTGEELVVRSEMNDGGTLFGDGIERDRIILNWGATVKIGIARKQLCLVER